MIVNYWKFSLRLMAALGVVIGAFWLALPGATLAALLLLIVGLVAVYLFKDTRTVMRYDSHFATKGEVRSLTRGALCGDGVLIGFAYRQLLCVRPGTAGKQELGHFLWVGPNRSGKGLSLTSNLYNWEGSAIVVDIKGELAQATAGYRQRELGQDVYILNPSTGERSHQFDPFQELHTDEQIFAAAVAFMNPEQDGSNAVFARRAASALAAAIKAARLQGRPVIPYLDELLFHPDGVRGAALAMHRLGSSQVSKWLNAFLSKDPDRIDWKVAAEDRFLNNSWQRLITSASALTTSGVRHMTGGRDFTALDLKMRPTTLYLVFRESELAANLPLLNLTIDALFGALLRHADLHPAAAGHKILALFDEAFRASPTRLPDYAATVSGRGISMGVYVQSIAQLADVWGPEGKTSIMENFHTKVFLPPIDRSDADRGGTSAYVAASCGRYLVEDRGLSKHEHEKELNTTIRFAERELITASEFAMLGLGKTIILCNDFPPILSYRLEPWRLRDHAYAAQCPFPSPPKASPVDGERPEDSAAPLPPQEPSETPAIPRTKNYTF